MSRKVPGMALGTVTDRISAPDVDPIELAERLHREREDRNQANMEKWRTWMAANLERVLALSDAEASDPRTVPWLFPTGARSRTDPEAPAISRGALRELVQRESALKQGMRRAFDRMMVALGLEDRAGALAWRAGPLPWALGRKHDRRVYRLLRSVHSAGLHTEAQKLMSFLERELGGDPARLHALRWYRHQVAS